MTTWQLPLLLPHVMPDSAAVPEIDAFIALVASDPAVGGAEFQELLTAADLSFDDGCNAVALRVARRFVLGRLSWPDGDAVANFLWTRMCERLPDSGRLPEPAMGIFEAFDAGEFHRTRDRSDDPVQAYTLPLLREILGVIDQDGERRR